MPFNRSALLTAFLVLAVLSVTIKIALLWYEGPSDLAWLEQSEARTEPREEAAAIDGEIIQPAPVSVRSIIDRNLFDPDRASGSPRASSSHPESLQGLVLVGTALLGTSRVAIFHQPPGAGAPGYLRLKVGDQVDGFRLSEIHQRRVVFTRGPTRVEVPLDLSAGSERARKSPSPPAPQSFQPQASPPLTPQPMP